MKLMSCSIILTLFFSCSVFGYEVGDVIDPHILKKLDIPPGKIGIVDFFASWCLSCEKEIPGLKKFIKNDKSGSTYVIGIDVDESLDDAKRFQERLNISFPVINDVDQRVIKAFSPIGMPSLYYIKDNKVIGKRIGSINHIDKKIIEDMKTYGVIR